DGIRDLIVTGVQTCALPIYAEVADALRGDHRPGSLAEASPAVTIRRCASAIASASPHPGTNRGGEPRWMHGSAGSSSAWGCARRSEERRVGKEGRARGWAHQ